MAIEEAKLHGYSLSVQVTGLQDEGVKVRTRPPICVPQSVKTQRAWLSAQGEDWTLTHRPHTELGKTAVVVTAVYVSNIKNNCN